VALVTTLWASYETAKWGCDINPNPMDDNDSYIDPLIHRDWEIRGNPIWKNNPEINPMDETDGESGPYTGPYLGAIGNSNGGTSTGAWNEQNGGLYLGPSLHALAESFGGTSTGTDWL